MSGTDIKKLDFKCLQHSFNLTPDFFQLLKHGALAVLFLLCMKVLIAKLDSEITCIYQNNEANIIIFISIYFDKELMVYTSVNLYVQQGALQNILLF